MGVLKIVVIALLCMTIFLNEALARRDIKEDPQDQKTSLQGVHDAVINVKIGMSLEGPTQRLLQADVERRLKEIPLNLTTVEESYPPETPTFTVEVAMLKTGTRSSVHFVTAKLYQLVTLTRDEPIRVYASTWNASNIGDGTLESIREKIDRLLDLFIGDYRWANPSN